MRSKIQKLQERRALTGQKLAAAAREEDDAYETGNPLRRSVELPRRRKNSHAVRNDRGAFPPPLERHHQNKLARSVGRARTHGSFGVTGFLIPARK